MTYRKVCPRCGSVNAVPNLSGRAVAVGTFVHESKCMDCGYEGIFPEIEGDASPDPGAKQAGEEKKRKEVSTRQASRRSPSGTR